MTSLSILTNLHSRLYRYDKITNSSLRGSYMSKVVDQAYPFSAKTQAILTEHLNSLVPLYADLATNGDTDDALKQLKAQLREHVVWERNTVWRCALSCSCILFPKLMACGTGK